MACFNADVQIDFVVTGCRMLHYGRFLIDIDTVMMLACFVRMLRGVVGWIPLGA
jgi:hypothetical protein